MSKKQDLSKQANRPQKKDFVPRSKQGNGTSIEQDGVIIENCGNTNFKVQLEINPDIIVMGTISGKMRMHYIRVGVGDKVKVEMSPYDLTKCRIVHRYKI